MSAARALLAILIGFYGNWYFNLLTRLEETQNPITWLVTGISAFSLFMYCGEITSIKKSDLTNKITFRFSLSTVHLISTYCAMLAIEGWFPPTPTALLGLFLWITIFTYEKKLPI